MPDLHLGLIGDNISASSSPRLHRLAGAQNRMAVQYDSLIPAEQGKPFEELFKHCRQSGYDGLNITYPYKETVIRYVTVQDPQVARIGAVNTVVFSSDGPLGFNTDYSGFLSSYQKERGTSDPGPVLLVGTGGVGRAIAFALLTLGARDIRLSDCSLERAYALAADLRAAVSDPITVTVGRTVSELAEGVKGLLNCTPLGMVGRSGTAIPAEDIPGAEWVFDAVYTPVDTQFLQDAAKARAQIISGYELFFYQGVNAWTFFSRRPLNEAQLRRSLLENEDTLSAA